MKLEYKNSWENDIYTVGGKPVLTLTEVRIDKVNYKVTSREVVVPYNDMGHEYHSRSVHYFVKAKVFGKMREFDLNSVKGTIEAVIYTVGEKS